MAKIAIIGVGAIGGVAAAALESTGQHELILCTRSPMTKLVVKSPDGVSTSRLENFTDPEGPATVVDWVLVATKVYDAGSAAAWFPRLCRPDMPVAIIQNGVEHVENYSRFIRPDLIVPVIVDCPAERKEDRSIVLRGGVRMQVKNKALGAAYAKLFKGSQVELLLEDDFVSALWKKLSLNAAGAVCALLAKPSGALRDEGLGEIVLDIVEECMAVARAEGAHLDTDLGPQILKRFRDAPPDSINSILGDRLAGRPLESDARNGVIVRKGTQHGIKTPVNRMVVALLKGMAADSGGGLARHRSCPLAAS
jgi:2-dehydropantoate 2-reductase